MDTVAVLASVVGLTPREGAARFAAAGIPVFPCKPAQKRPLTEHGFHDATTDAEQLGRWWTQWPQANIGMPTGHASGLEVVDVDVHGAVRGFAAFELARREGLADRWQALVKTASGGMHAYYPADPDHEQPSWQAARSGIDFRGKGGYVIVPPSLVLFEGNRSAYELIGAGHGESVPIDGAALRAFLDPKPAPVSTMTTNARRDVDVERIAAWLATRPEGERNRALYWAACRLAENGVTDQSARTVLGPAAQHAGLGQSEVLTTIRSAYRTVAAPTSPFRSRGAQAVAHPINGQVIS
ncbi:bifunctional DNA primase/polymerase [Microbacterium sp. NPDC058021]|uniref:bifunctional DNA primase/polymerase n=1 Tax=Microbacterium sp. NPDC058021 TaxID=3346306 RepID=UPI0036DCBAD5